MTLCFSITCKNFIDSPMQQLSLKPIANVFITYLQDFSKHTEIPRYRGAIPPLVLHLLLAFFNSQLGAFPNTYQNIRVLPTQFEVRKTSRMVTDGLGTKLEHLRNGPLLKEQAIKQSEDLCFYHNYYLVEADILCLCPGISICTGESQ